MELESRWMKSLVCSLSADSINKSVAQGVATHAVSEINVVGCGLVNGAIKRRRMLIELANEKQKTGQTAPKNIDGIHRWLPA